MTTLTTLNVKCIRSDGTPAFENPRFLRVVASGPSVGQLCVMRHDAGVVVKGVVKPDTVLVDLAAPRIDGSLLRPSTLADIGLVTKAKAAKAEPAKPGDLAEFVTKYTGTVKRHGETWLRNAMSHTKDPVKLEAMKIALGEAEPKAKAKRDKAAAYKVVASEPAAVMAMVAEPVAADKPAIVSELAEALLKMGVEPAKIEAALKGA